MRRLLLAAALALALHTLLFTIRFEGLGAKPILPPRPITLLLAEEPAEPLPSLAVSKIQEPQEPPPPHRPQLAEEKVQRQKTRKPERSPKKVDPSVAPQQEQAHISAESHGIIAEEVPATRPSQESTFPATASLGQGAQSLKPPTLHEATPLYRQNPVPEYPLAARKRGFRGTVVLEVLVNRQGRVADLRLSNSSGYSVLDQAALKSVKDWLFDPGTRAGEKVDMWVKVPVRFHLE